MGEFRFFIKKSERAIFRLLRCENVDLYRYPCVRRRTRKKAVATVFRKRMRLQTSRKTERDFLRKRRNSSLGEFRFFIKKSERAIFRLFRRGKELLF